MTLWTDIAEWRGPVLHHSGTIGDHMYVVIHIAEGSYEGTISWQKNPDSGNSSHFVVREDGHIAQVNDTANRSGAQIDGNPYSIAIENAGFSSSGLTAAQIDANARIMAKAHQVYGIPLQLTGKVGVRGLGHHSMGAESGANWGHSQCPGSIIKSQKQAILNKAIAIINGPPLAAIPPSEAAMIFQVTNVPAGTLDCVGTTLPENAQCLATPAGPFALSGSEFFSQPDNVEPNRITMSYTRLQALCNALRTAAELSAAALTEVKSSAQQGGQQGASSAIDGATITAAAS